MHISESKMLVFWWKWHKKQFTYRTFVFECRYLGTDDEEEEDLAPNPPQRRKRTLREALSLQRRAHVSATRKIEELSVFGTTSCFYSTTLSKNDTI